MKYKNVLFHIDKFKSPITPFGENGVEFNHEAGTFRMENFPASAFKKFCRDVKDRGEKYVLFYCKEVSNVNDSKQDN